MMRRVPLLLLMLGFALPSSAVAIELVTNGGFEDELSPAWQEDVVGAAAVIDRATGYDGDQDYEVLVQKGTGNGHARLDQTIVIPSTDLAFSVNAMLKASATEGGTPWAAAGVALHYEDGFGNVQGTTMILCKTTACPWIDSDTLHLIPAPDENWNNFGFNLDDELLNLSGVDPLAIHQIRFSLVGQTGGDC
jgi:hypothetical protein